MNMDGWMDGRIWMDGWMDENVWMDVNILIIPNLCPVGR